MYFSLVKIENTDLKMYFHDVITEERLVRSYEWTALTALRFSVCHNIRPLKVGKSESSNYNCMCVWLTDWLV